MGGRGLVLWLGIVVGALAPATGWSLCNCTGVDGCQSALACDGKNPGDECSPPRNATCKIVQGDAGGLSCCCGCSRGVGPLSCVFDGVVEQLAALDALVCEAASITPAGLLGCACADRKLDKRTQRAVGQAGRKLTLAQDGCGKGKDPRKKVDAAKKKLRSLEGVVDKLVDRDKVTPECGVALKGLIADLGVEIDDAAAGGGSTPTTTTTLPGGPTCSGALATPPGYPDERNFEFTCTGPQDLSFSGFTLQAPDGYQFVNQIDPNGFTCQILPPSDVFSCTGPFGTGTPVVGGRVAISPAPAAPFAIDLRVQNGATFGPFPLE